jgi:hypothetical protein
MLRNPGIGFGGRPYAWLMPRKVHPVADAVRRARKAVETGRLVDVGRSIPGTHPITGFVLAVSESLVLMAEVNDAVFLDGYRVLRLRDLVAVTAPLNESFVTEALALRDVRVDPLPWIDLGSMAATCASVDEHTDLLVVLATEHDHPDEVYIGKVAAVTGKNVKLREIDPQGDWHSRLTKYSHLGISSVGFGDRYSRALRDVAGARGWSP